MTGTNGGRLRTAARAFAASARSPSVRRVQLGFAGACTAEWTFTVVLSVYAFQHGGAEAVGLVSLLRMLPSAVLAPFGSALADRCRRDIALTVVSVARCGTAAGIALAAAAGGSEAVVYGLAIGSTAAALLYRPVSSALLPLLCQTPTELAQANVVRGLLDSISTLVGPALAAALLATRGTASGFVAVAVLSGLSATASLGLRVEEPERSAARGSVLGGLLVGARAAVQSGPMRVLTALLAAQVVSRGAVSVFSVLVAVDLLHIGDPGVGTLTSAIGAGAVVGSLFASVFVGNRRLASWFGVGVALWGLPLALLAAVPHEVPALALFAVLGVGNALVDVGLFTLVARLVPERELIGVFGLLECLGGLAVGGGSVLAAWLASATSLRVALVVVGALGPAVVVVSWALLRRLDDTMAARDEDLALLRRVAVLDPLPLPALEQLAAGLRPRQVAAGDTVYTQGDAADGCVVIEHGTAEVLGDGRRVAELGPGELVGEIALLRRVPRTATVRALTDLDLRMLDGDRFLLVVTGWESSRVVTGEHVDDLLGRYSPEA
ncbi:MAG TPA: MFS transporter [Nocardioides sp.]|uniref:MFS transporter n=1 Tax=Nocardioides sp. TaxID=35761 RepID=UPI002E31E600|nr:MFS transporter [Nocardioides sp.]HEX3930379.1 MFS transporter [Nocardioides sp.]